MNVQFSKEFLRTYKKVDVRIQNSIDKEINLFKKNPMDSSLNSHELQREYAGLRSIDITADYRAIYEEVTEGEETFAFFIIFGTHNELYT